MPTDRRLVSPGSPATTRSPACRSWSATTTSPRPTDPTATPPATGTADRPTLNGATLTVDVGEDVTCTITNDDQAAHLTLVKTVTNNNGGTAEATDWTLTGDGPTPITGATGTDAVTNATVDAGDYDLTEADGPDGYTPSSWVCPGATVTAGGVVTVANGADVTCTINNNDQAAHLTLVKTVTNDNGGTAEASDWTLSADGPTSGISGATGTGAVTDVPVAAGDYDLTEADGPDGYTPSDWDCGPADQSGGTVTVNNGDDVTCTINNNDQAAHLTLVKTVTNNNGGTAKATDWTLTGDGPTPITGATGTDAVTNATVDAGDYDLSEADGPEGYTPSDWDCGPADQSGGTVTVNNGDDVTCTINNDDQPATLTLVKVVDENATGSGKVPADWTLTATPDNITGQGPVSGNGDPTVPGSVNEVTVFAGDYDLSESGPAGFDSGSWICQGGVVSGADEATVTVPNGGNVVCTITNTAISPTLTLVKTVTNDDGGTAVATDWTLTADGPTPINGATGTATVTDAPVMVGDYDLSEAGPGGYDAGDWSCEGGDQDGDTITLAEGDDVTCTINNDDQPATLTLVKVVDNGETGATTDPEAWILTAVGPTPGISGVTGDPAVTRVPVDAGSYDLAESEGPEGYRASSWVCTGASDSTVDSVELGVGDNARCTITNTAIPPTLTLVKKVVNDNGGTAVATDWTLSADGPTPGISGVTGDDEVTGLPVMVGDYDLSEADGPDGYTPSDWDCGPATLNGATLTVDVGEDVTCTITNDDQAAHLTLVKTVTNNNGGTAEATDWTLTGDGPTPISGATGTDAVTNATVDAGDYDLTEADGPDGYTPSDWDCTNDTVVDDDITTVTVNNGDNVTCTINNSDNDAFLTLIKTVTNDNGGTAEATDWTLTGNGPSDVISGVTGTDDVTRASVDSGDWELSEGGGPGGYTPGDWDCTNDTVVEDGITTVTVNNGDDVTCTINNNDDAAHLTLVKTVTNDNGGTAKATDWTLTGDGPTPITGATGTDAVTNATVDAGDYDLSEADGPEGYTPSDWDCGPADQSGSTVTVNNGADVTCTINNNDQAGRWAYEKSSDPASGSTVKPGDVITYTLTAAHTTGTPTKGVVLNDDLSDVLDDATLVPGSITPSTGTATVRGTELTWKIPTLSGTETITYQVKVDKDAWDARLDNVVSSDGGTACLPTETGRTAHSQAAKTCTETTHFTPHESTPPGPPTPTPDNPGIPGLPNTGGPAAWILALGVILCGLGAGAVLLSRRRSHRVH